MMARTPMLALILLAATVVASACGASDRLDGGPGPLPNRAGPLSNDQGNQSYSDQLYDDALDAYVRATQELPDRAEPHYNAGNTRYRQQRFEEAWGQYLEALVTADPELAQRSVFNIGNAFYSADQFNEAIESYQEALRLDPDDIDAKHNLELALLQLEQKGEEGEEEEQDPQEGPDPQSQEPSQEEQEQPPPDPQGDQEQPPGDSPPDGEQTDQPTDESQPGPVTELTEDQARQLLEAIGDNTKTLRSVMRQDTVVPGDPPERDW